MLCFGRLHESRQIFNSDLEVQLLLKQGQVEVDPGQFIPNFKTTLLIHREVVEELNKKIRVKWFKSLSTLGSQRKCPRAPAGMCKVVHLHPPGFCFPVFCRPLSMHTIAQSLTQKHRQTLFYRVIYDIRCWCSTSRHQTGLPSTID